VPAGFSSDSQKLLLPLNAGDMNLVTVESTGDVVRADILLEYPDPLGAPAISRTQGAAATVSLDTAARLATLHVKLFNRTLRAYLLTNVLFSRVHAVNRNSGERYRVKYSSGIDTMQLLSGNSYDILFSKPGYPLLRTSMRTGYNDTLLAIKWEPVSRIGAMLRSAALPGWGQQYTRRDWIGWSCAAATALAATGIFYMLQERSYRSYQENNTLYLITRNQRLRAEYNRNRQRAASLHWLSRPAFFGAGAATALIWALSAIDAYVYLAGPEGLWSAAVPAANIAFTAPF
jgi:hypothetical protein